MEYGRFQADGSQYVIHTPRTPARWFNYLFNDTYYMEVSQTGQGKSIGFLPKHRDITRNGYKYFYILDHESGEAWCPAYQPLKSRYDSYACTHALGWTEIDSVSHQIHTSIRAYVPREGMREIWEITLRNLSDKPRKLSLFSVFSIENGGVMGSKCDYNEEHQLITSFSFPYHVFYEEKAKNEQHSNLVYLFSDKTPVSYDCSERRFFGGDVIDEVPAAILSGQCSNQLAEAENPIAAFQHAVELQPNQEDSMHLVYGCARTVEEVAAIKRSTLKQGFSSLFSEVEGYWRAQSEIFHVETPDEHVNHFMNHWLKKQIILQTRSNRMSVYCPIRNQLQDAMGYAMVDPSGAVVFMESVLKGQETTGFIQQWIMTDGTPPQKLCLLKHMDGPVWLIMCTLAIIELCGDISLLDREVGFKDTDGQASIYRHLLLAVQYMYENRGAHGLCLMGDGDWNDPINGPGRGGKGESAWSTMALKYAIRMLMPFSRSRGDTEVENELEKAANELDTALNDTCWDGEWYIAGYDDEGVPFGSAKDEEGSLFLNTQTWAIMSETARGGRLEQCLAAIDRLDTPFGPLLLDPPFSKWNPTWGRISVKLAGTTENGSVYCHASMFKAYADCVAGRGEKAFETIRRTLPTNPDNPPEVNLQVPTFVPNFYFGLADSPNFGQSSHHHSTGTVGWMLWTTMEHVLGIRSTVNGINIQPCIPPEWEGYQVTKTFRDARYDIRVYNPNRVSGGRSEITVNGQSWSSPLLPCEPGNAYTVRVTLG